MTWAGALSWLKVRTLERAPAPLFGRLVQCYTHGCSFTVYTKLQVANNNKKHGSTKFVRFICLSQWQAVNSLSFVAPTSPSNFVELYCCEAWKVFMTFWFKTFGCFDWPLSLVLLWSLESLHSFLVQDFWVLWLAAQSCTAVKPGIVILCNYYPTIGICGQRVRLPLELLRNTLEQMDPQTCCPKPLGWRLSQNTQPCVSIFSLSF